MAANGFGLCVRCLCALARVSASNDAKPVLAAVFLLLVISALENILKISLKKVCSYQNRLYICINI